MTVHVEVQADNAILIYNEGDARSRVLIETVEDAVRLTMALHGAGSQLYGEQVWRRAKMRAIVADG